MTRPVDHDPPVILWGRCRSASRWFWAARVIGGEDRHGWAANRNDAARKANRTAVLLAGGQYASIRIDDAVAETRLAAATEAKHAKAKAENQQRAAKGDDAVNLYAVEFGYYDHGACRWVPSRIVRLPVTKTTAKRIYFLRSSEPGEYETGYIDRQDFETRGWVYSTRFNKIYAKPPKLPDDKPFIPPPLRPEYGYPRATVTEQDVKALKAAMRAAHPDMGGSDAAFIKAHAAYKRARALVAATKEK